jgi:vacuolar protein sorting-associated protein 8
LTWADRILSFVQDGDFLSAIELARSYYVGEATGNRNGLPDDPKILQDIVGEKMRELMTASARYAFSEERMSDSTHITPDGRGVDRTSLFEGLVATCTRASIALGDFDFLFEDLFQYYDGSGIARIYLTQLEPFILDSTLPEMPPRITQKIVAMHAEDGRPDLAERVIWHIDPACLDINQVISLCQAHYLYDALIYVYTRALKDYVSPIVELIGLVRRVQRFRRDRHLHIGQHASDIVAAEEAIEPFVVNAYKVYPYLADILSGLTYPSQEPLSQSEADQAKDDVYKFFFFGGSSVWPDGEGGKLVLTSDEEGGVEPTYPYLRLLLRFDAESLLNSLDLAFEDSYFNDENCAINRLVIVKVLLEILSSSDISPSDTMFVNIFIARNVPKYQQSIEITPSVLHSILVSLAEYPDQHTREDRQLAAEFLLSVYTPHDGDRILQLFEQAGFYRILRTWHRQDRQWGPLIQAFLMDPEIRPSDVFVNVDDVLQLASRLNQGVLPPDLRIKIAESIPDLLHASVADTATLLDKHAPTFHTQALEALGIDADDKRFDYLRCLFGLPPLYDDGSTGWRQVTPPSHIPQTLRRLYVSLQCKADSPNVINALSRFPADFFDWSEVLQACEDHNIYDAVVWGLNWIGDPERALRKADIFQKNLIAGVLENLGSLSSSHEDAARNLDNVLAIARRAIDLCLEHSRTSTKSTVKPGAEDMWFELLRGQIECAQAVSEYCSSHDTKSAGDIGGEGSRSFHALAIFRSLIQETFSSLVSVSSTRQISFPRLFKRLVDAATHSSREIHYTEFRAVLTGMLESYRSDGDILTITKHLIDRDVFDTIEEMARTRVRGWMPQRVVCHSCGRILFSGQAGRGLTESRGIVTSRSGLAYHDVCYLQRSESRT